jgi:hypothetical protein
MRSTEIHAETMPVDFFGSSPYRVGDFSQNWGDMVFDGSVFVTVG